MYINTNVDNIVFSTIMLLSRAVHVFHYVEIISEIPDLCMYVLPDVFPTVKFKKQIQIGVQTG
jgi:hypothetical protein